MSLPSTVTDLTDIITDMASSTGWTLISSGGGGANSFTVPETDDYIQGSNCISRNPFSSSIRGMVYNSSQTIPTDSAVFVWSKSDVAQALDDTGSGGIQVLIGSGTGALDCFYVDGGDLDNFGGWKCYVVDPNATPSTSIGSPSGTTSYFGVRWSVPSSGPSKGFPFKIDAIRYGSYFRTFDGDSSTPITFDTLNDYLAYGTTFGISHQYGQLTKKKGTFEMQSKMIIGASSFSAYFVDSNRAITILDTPFVVSTFNGIHVQHSSTLVDWSNISFLALGTNAPGVWTVESGDDPTVNLNSCIFTAMGTFAFSAGTTSTGTQFNGCDKITQNGATFTGGTVISASTNAVAMLADDIDLISNTTFVSDGTGHAIELTAAHAGGSYTLTDVTFTGYGAGSTTDSAIYNNSGGAVTINISGGTTPTIRNGTGATTTVVAGAVSVTLSVSTVTGTAISGAQVFVKCASGGSLPFEASVTIANSGTTATVTHTGHGLATNDKVVIYGASHYQNNGVFTITVTGTNTYTYTMGSAPGSSPTGTITSTFVLLYGTTNGSGEITMSRVFPGAQPVTGWARKSSSAPYYKTGPVNGTVSTGSGANLSAILIADQ